MKLVKISDSSPPDDGYELLDFGEGRKLERFAGRIVDRPSPSASQQSRAHPDWWSQADAFFEEKPAPRWATSGEPKEWIFRWESVSLELRCSPYGHVGLFPEQIANWRWLSSLAALNPLAKEGGPRVLNLFAYTGGMSLALAARGWSVTHVDASRPTVEWARRNAFRSGMATAKIRWIVDDVRSFVSREVRRGARYDAIVMDPPAYGHGASGQAWDIRRDLDSLVLQCRELLVASPRALLLTGHSPIESLETGPLAPSTWSQLGMLFPHLHRHRVGLLDRSRRKLDLGYAYRLFA